MLKDTAGRAYGLLPARDATDVGVPSPHISRTLPAAMAENAASLHLLLRDLHALGIDHLWQETPNSRRSAVVRPSQNEAPDGSDSFGYTPAYANPISTTPTKMVK